MDRQVAHGGLADRLFESHHARLHAVPVDQIVEDLVDRRGLSDSGACGPQVEPLRVRPLDHLGQLGVAQVYPWFRRCQEEFQEIPAIHDAVGSPLLGCVDLAEEPFGGSAVGKVEFVGVLVIRELDHTDRGVDQRSNGIAELVAGRVVVEGQENLVEPVDPGEVPLDVLQAAAGPVGHRNDRCLESQYLGDREAVDLTFGNDQARARPPEVLAEQVLPGLSGPGEALGIRAADVPADEFPVGSTGCQVDCPA